MKMEQKTTQRSGGNRVDYHYTGHYGLMYFFSNKLVGTWGWIAIRDGDDGTELDSGEVLIQYLMGKRVESRVLLAVEIGVD